MKELVAFGIAVLVLFWLRNKEAEGKPETCLNKAKFPDHDTAACRICSPEVKP